MSSQTPSLSARECWLATGSLGITISATFYEQRYAYYVQHYAANNDLTSFGLQDALMAVPQLLQRAGEIPAWLATQTEAVVYERLLAEATMAAYQDYFFLAALVIVLSIAPQVSVPAERGVTTPSSVLSPQSLFSEEEQRCAR